MTTVVSNASPIIVLSKMGELSRLEELFGTVVITPEVYEEVVQRGKGKPGADELAGSRFFRVTPVKDTKLIKDLQATRNLGTGEAATLALAKELAADLVLVDDKQARSMAEAERLTVVGTLRVLELSYERGHLSDLAEAYRRLKSTPLWIRTELLNESLKRHNLPPLG